MTLTTEPGVGFVAEKAVDFAPYENFISQLQQQNPRLGITLIVPDEQQRLAVQQVLTGFNAVKLPLRIFATRFLSQLRVRALAVVPPLAALPTNISAAAQSRAVPVMFLSLSTQAVDLLEMVGRERAWEDRTDRPIARWAANALAKRVENGQWQGRIKRLSTLSQLPISETILCLGNGPSSEDPRTLSYKDATLFRANHGWMSRAHLTKPDVVFTGTQASMRKLRSTIIAVYGATAERNLLMARAPHLITQPLQYFVADALVPIQTNFDWGQHRPTSGAVMLATAVALNPKRLVVAGFDLFSHAAGAYPGAPPVANAYTAAHDGEKEAAFIRKILTSYAGELTIFGPALEKLLQS